MFIIGFMRKYLKIIGLLSLSVLLSHCAHQSKNLISDGELVLYGGVKGQKKWSDKLEFKRYSWLHEFTMWFDVSIASIGADSPFNAWINEDERSMLSSCRKWALTLSYALDSKKISEKDFLSQVRAQGIEQILLPRLASNISSHPDFDQLGLNRHHIYVLCQKGPPLPLVVEFSGFESLHLENF